LDAINTALEELKIARVETLDDIGIRIQEIASLISPVKNISGLQKTQALYETIEQIPSVESLLENAQKYAKDRKELSEEESKIKGHLYVQVLENGLAWIKEDNLQNCPLCNNPISLPDVEIHIASCLESNKGLITAKEKLANSQSSFVELAKSFTTSLERVSVNWKKTVEIKTPVDIDSLIKTLKALIVSHKKILSLSQIENDIVKLTAIDLNTQVLSLKSAIEDVLSEFPGSDRYIKLFDVKNKLSGFDTHYIKGVLKVGSRIETLTYSKNHIAVVLGIAETSRKATVQKLLDAIVNTADKYFQKIHPGEEIGKPELIVSSRGTGSIELKSEFHGETGDPRGHYSEGHVDSLGLCLFLAIRRLQSLQKPELSLLILDDVMHSVDARHRLDTANLIIEEFSDHQIIITTHDPFWFEYLKMITKKSKNMFGYKRIAEWTLQDGPIFGDHFSNYEWLASSSARSAKPSDRVGKAGLLLEEMLQNLCNNLAISVTFKIRGDYTVEPLWSGFYSTAKKHIGFIASADNILQQIEDLKSLRNWAGAHWNQWAQTLTSSEADRFVDSVISLRSIVYCEECNQFISRISGLDSVWSCKSEHKRYNKTV
jgi:DNA repair exonuclease SbcCD ATPase subunit